MKKSIIIVAFIVVVLVGILLVANTSSVTDNDVKSEFSLIDISAHDSGDDCWMAIKGKVYDASPFIEKGIHGAAIVQGCGSDATLLFETRPMGSGTPHSANARSMLIDYYIGELE